MLNTSLALPHFPIIHQEGGAAAIYFAPTTEAGPLICDQEATTQQSQRLQRMRAREVRKVGRPLQAVRLRSKAGGSAVGGSARRRIQSMIAAATGSAQNNWLRRSAQSFWRGRLQQMDLVTFQVSRRPTYIPARSFSAHHYSAVTTLLCPHILCYALVHTSKNCPPSQKTWTYRMQAQPNRQRVAPLCSNCGCACYAAAANNLKSRQGLRRHLSGIAGSEDGVGLSNASVRLMAGLDCWALRRVLLQVARRFPRTLDAILCGGLSPAAAELLTARFEAADAQLAEQGAPANLKIMCSLIHGMAHHRKRCMESC